MLGYQFLCPLEAGVLFLAERPAIDPSKLAKRRSVCSLGTPASCSSPVYSCQLVLGCCYAWGFLHDVLPW
ncbi:hypothetical protein J4Q44_G00361300 [Coregonus suidteri]|uniref:Uncharacterized protein n=1 Tax=Coregonus suidteri TaxID=861788 RepID=A0AAN8KQV2_9TELE